jgi:polyhydroxyalkanoate synthesis regulator phasin
MRLSLRDRIEDLVLNIMERNDITKKQAREILSEILSNSSVQEEIHKDAKAWVRLKRGSGEWR